MPISAAVSDDESGAPIVAPIQMLRPAMRSSATPTIVAPSRRV